VLVRRVCRPRRARIDDDDTRTVPPTGLRQEVPAVVAGRDGVRAPHEREPGFGHLLGVEANRVAFVLHLAGRCAAHAAVVGRRAHRVEDAQERPPLHDAHRAEVAERQHRLGPVALDHAQQPGRDDVQRLVPGRPPELAGPLRSGPDQRVEQPVFGVGAPLVVAHLGAEPTARDRVVAGAGDLRDAAVLDRGDPGAGVLAVQRTAALDESDLTHFGPQPVTRAAPYSGPEAQNGSSTIMAARRPSFFPRQASPVLQTRTRSRSWALPTAESANLHFVTPQLAVGGDLNAFDEGARP
jgi:hypothetical protein